MTRYLFWAIGAYMVTMLFWVIYIEVRVWASRRQLRHLSLFQNQSKLLQEKRRAYREFMQLTRYGIKQKDVDELMESLAYAEENDKDKEGRYYGEFAAASKRNREQHRE